MKILLGKDEIRILKLVLEKLTTWDKNALVRVRTKSGVVGVYAAPPFGVITLTALPIADSIEDFDHVLVAGKVLAQLDESSGIDLALFTQPVHSAALALLPPEGPWLPGEKGMSGDVMPKVKERLEKLKQQVAPLSAVNNKKEIDAVTQNAWDEKIWGGLPFGALNAAAALGMLAHPGTRISAALCNGWKRLLTPTGQVFVKPDSNLKTIFTLIK
jgi:hypothetical protein